MKVVVADKILALLGLEKTSDNYQKIYKIGDLILKDADDYFVYETAIERGLVEVPKCKVCGKEVIASMGSWILRIVLGKISLGNISKGSV